MSDRFYIGRKNSADISLSGQTPSFYSEHDVVQLRDDEAKHIVKVLRKKCGDEVLLFDGEGAEYLAQITEESKNCVGLEILKIVRTEKRSRPELTLAAALPKGDRQKWMIEKLTELDIDVFVPLETERSVSKAGENVCKRLERQVQEASKQSGRLCLMKISEEQPVLAFWTSFNDCVWASEKSDHTELSVLNLDPSDQKANVSDSKIDTFVEKSEKIAEQTQKKKKFAEKIQKREKIVWKFLAHPISDADLGQISLADVLETSFFLRRHLNESNLNDMNLREFESSVPGFLSGQTSVQTTAQTSNQLISQTSVQTTGDWTKRLTEFPDEIVVAVGPEGGFSSEETKAALENDWIPLNLGDQVLRVETAAITAAAAFKILAQKNMS